MNKKGKIFILVIICILLVSFLIDESKKPSETPKKKEDETQTIVEEKEESTQDVETEKNYTEEEYKTACKEIYNDDFFKSEVEVGTFVKIPVMISSKYDYGITSMQGILVEEITEKYNLETNCIGCTVMHESTKNDSLPSYFGKQIYIMFVKDGSVNIDTFKTGQKLIIYGEVIQNAHGHYILPKYYE
jgi:hypothetical protein